MKHFFSLGEVTEGLPGANGGDRTPVAGLGAGSKKSQYEACMQNLLIDPVSAIRNNKYDEF